MNKKDMKKARSWASKNELGSWLGLQHALSGLTSFNFTEIELSLIASWLHKQACSEEKEEIHDTPEAVCAAHGYTFHRIRELADQEKIMRNLYHKGNQWCSANGSAWAWPVMGIIIGDTSVKPSVTPVKDDAYGLSVMRVKASSSAWSAVSRYNHAASGDVDRTDFSWRKELIGAMRHSVGLKGSDDQELPTGVMSANGVLYHVGEEAAGVYPTRNGYIEAGKHVELKNEAWVERGLIISLGVNPVPRMLPGSPAGIIAIHSALIEQLSAAKALGYKVTCKVDARGGYLMQAGEAIMTWSRA